MKLRFIVVEWHFHQCYYYSVDISDANFNRIRCIFSEIQTFIIYMYCIYCKSKFFSIWNLYTWVPSYELRNCNKRNIGHASDFGVLVQCSQSLPWYQLACQRLEVLNSYSLSQMQKVMTRRPITVMSYSVRTSASARRLFHGWRNVYIPTSHQAHDSLNMPVFIAPWLWPTNCSDLNPVDYEVWDML